MAKVVAVQVVYNNKKYIERVFNAIFKQTFKDLDVVAVICGNDDKGKEYLMEKFPAVQIIDPSGNIGFAKAHNLVFEKKTCDFFQLVNPDLILESDYIEKMLEAFKDEKVGAATGKLLKYDFDKNLKTNLIDTTGVQINKSGRAWDRGQHEVDNGQYDALISVQAVSAAGAMYRREALQKVKCQKSNVKSSYEYFDEDFHSYWEDVDLTWRMSNAGWKCEFAPKAIGFHGRGAGSSEGGYKKVFSFIKFHHALPGRIRQLNYQNHIFMFIKNSPYFYPEFFIREFFMLIYVLIFEIGTFKILPQMFKLLPKMWKKRKFLKKH